ncbi:UNKNOWN [Stylonychia lemnae]|uniref:Transmembrane protein n=1 Tax=Stylonychia lemnae TaxID=5949 RepID=A0A078A7P5_STYLE|nr:UNKNOWN [Stylonychia lemnae]|eukprot:CDW76806.1 UNKNOWN [Stylonychia lemnae]
MSTHGQKIRKEIVIRQNIKRKLSQADAKLEDQMMVSGSFAVEQAKFIQIAIRDCNQTYLNEKYNNTKQCKSKDEITRVASFLKLYIINQNSFFDDKSFEDVSVKKYLNTFYLTSFEQKSIYYYMHLSQNNIIRKDNMMYGSDIEEKFIETKIDHNVIQEINSTDPYNNAYIGVYIFMDDEVKQIERKVFNVSDALKNTGGFMSVVLIIAYILVYKIQQAIYYNTLIKSLYRYQNMLSEYKFQRKSNIEFSINRSQPSQREAQPQRKTIEDK